MICDYCANKLVCTDNDLDQLSKEFGKECLDNGFKYFEKQESEEKK